MSELKTLLDAYSRGESTLESVKKCLARYLTGSPEHKAYALRELKDARGLGLSQNTFDALTRALSAGVTGAKVSSPESPKAVAKAARPATDGANTHDSDRTQPETVTSKSGHNPTAIPGVRPEANAVVAAAVEADITAVNERASDTPALVAATGNAKQHETAATKSDHSRDDDTTLRDYTTADYDATEVNTAARKGDDTITLAPAAYPDDEATTVNIGLNRPVGSRIRARSTVDPAAEPPDATTRPKWSTAVGIRKQHAGSAQHEFHAGDVLRERFRLISQVGEGGMGTVWKAIDMLKEEAKDRNPYVAIKLLSADFKKHPEAFIALQRESAKAQRLAHPNIATVFDFDRDGDAVYMTMEVLEGQPLDSFIRQLPAGGLAEDTAMSLISQLAAGLSYAHRHNLVHSDLKPGNAFVTEDGDVKLLDFGIARASQTKDAEGETTVFDPGALGALTPAYATLEMFEGQESDPRDDIYALGVISYQLLTGKHPYGKLSAPRAMEKGLTPEPVSKLDKRQNRGLARAVAFERQKRTPTVDDFLADIRRRQNRTTQLIVGSAAALLIVAAIAYQPAKNVLREHAVEGVVKTITQGDTEGIIAALGTLPEYDAESQRAILDDPGVKGAVVDTYRQQVERVVDSSKGKYDFPMAERHVQKLQQLYPDSAQVLQIQTALESQKYSELARLNDKFNEYLAQGLMVPTKEQDDITDVLRIVGQIDPKHPLLNDRLLTIIYFDLTTAALEAKNYRRADLLIKTSLSYAPDDPALLNLRYRVDKGLQRLNHRILVARIEQRLWAEWNAIRSLSDYRRVNKDLFQLEELNPKSPILKPLQDGLRKALSQELARRIGAGHWQDAEQLLADFATVMDIPFLLRQRQAVSAARQKSGSPLQATPEKRAALDERKQTLETLLASPESTIKWETSVRSNYRALIAVLPFGDPVLETLRDDIAQLYIDRARESRIANRFDDAQNFVATGATFHPELEALNIERDAITAARNVVRKQHEEARRLARLERLKRTLFAKARADQPQEAKKILEELRQALPADDPLLVKDGPEAIGRAYLRLAERSAQREDFKSAAKLAEGGLDVATSLMEDLEEVLRAYNDEAKVAQLKKQLASAPLQVASLRGDLEEIKRLFPERYPKLREELAGILEKRIKSKEKFDPNQARELLESARQILPSSHVLADLEVNGPPKPSNLVVRGRKQIAAGKLTAARKTLEEALKTEGRHPELPGFQKSLEDQVANAEQMYESFLRFKAARRPAEGKPYLDRAIALWSDNPDYRMERTRLSAAAIGRACSPGLAGYGQRTQGTCYDTIAGGKRGPLLVVVPSGGGQKKPFAIGKHEVSINDYNLYCRTSERCKPVDGANPDLPVTGISFKQAEAYAEWLSEQTDAIYRLPTEAEWVYAAAAQGKQPSKDFNCRGQVNNRPTEDVSLIAVGNGKQNGWGLQNYVGNAQEWAVTASGLVARGGAYEDPLSSCDISLKRVHSGQADGITSFRLLREIG